MSRKRSSKTSGSPSKRLKEETGLTVEETKLYDRQIRLWGMEAQQRMRHARILVSGCTGLSNEILKNIVLAGVGSVTIADSTTVTESDLGSQFFLRAADIGLNKAKAVAMRVKALNPNVDVKIVDKSVEEQPDSFYDAFDIVCLVGTVYPPAFMTRIDGLCRSKKISFWAAAVVGLHGFMFCDLGEYSYVVTDKQKDAAKPTRVEKSLSFESLQNVLSKRFGKATLEGKALIKWGRKAHPLFFALSTMWEFFKEHGRFATSESDMNSLLKLKIKYMNSVECSPAFLPDDLVKTVARQWGKELPSTCAILGGLLAQDILKILARSDPPTKNFLLYDSWNAVAQVMDL